MIADRSGRRSDLHHQAGEIARRGIVAGQHHAARRRHRGEIVAGGVEMLLVAPRQRLHRGGPEVENHQEHDEKRQALRGPAPRHQMRGTEARQQRDEEQGVDDVAQEIAAQPERNQQQAGEGRDHQPCLARLASEGGEHRDHRQRRAGHADIGDRRRALRGPAAVPQQELHEIGRVRPLPEHRRCAAAAGDLVALHQPRHHRERGHKAGRRRRGDAAQQRRRRISAPGEIGQHIGREIEPGDQAVRLMGGDQGGDGENDRCPGRPDMAGRCCQPVDGEEGERQQRQGQRLRQRALVQNEMQVGEGTGIDDGADAGSGARQRIAAQQPVGAPAAGEMQGQQHQLGGDDRVVHQPGDAAGQPEEHRPGELQQGRAAVEGVVPMAQLALRETIGEMGDARDMRAGIAAQQMPAIEIRMAEPEQQPAEHERDAEAAASADGGGERPGAELHEHRHGSRERGGGDQGPGAGGQVQQSGLRRRAGRHALALGRDQRVFQRVEHEPEHAAAD